MKIKVRDPVRSVDRSVEQVSLGCHFNGAAAPHPDNDDVKTLELGVRQRIGRQMPRRDIGFLDKLRNHTQEAILHYQLEPIDAEYGFLFEEWLAGTNYNLKRKEELRRLMEEIVDLLARNDAGELQSFKVKLFMKDEPYLEFKNGRGIYAREDAAKCFFGPYFKAIENRVYYDPETNVGIKHFIKHVPVDLRPDFLMEQVYMEGFRYVCTDYSALEAHFDNGLYSNCEFILYEHMLGSNPHGRFACSIMREVLIGVNIVQNKKLSARILGRRMSGEMNTSLGNGWTNLMLYTLWSAENGLSFDKVMGVIEGDDGLFALPPDVDIPTEEFFKSWGCFIKIIIAESISVASFCGLVFDPAERKIVSDPFKILLTFGYTSKRYAQSRNNKLKALLRAKAMSALVQYHGCPIVGALAEKMLELTRSSDVRHVIETTQDEWQRNKLKYGLANFKKYLGGKVGSRTRELFFDLYGIPVSVQENLEARILSMDTIAPLNFPELIPSFSSDALDYFEKYSCVYTIKNGRFVIFDGSKIS